MLLTLALLSVLHSDSLPGTWKITGDIMGKPLNERCIIKQTGAAVSGSCTNESGGPWEVTGEVKDGKVTFKHGGDYNGEPLTIIYSAPLGGTLKGTVEVQPFGATGTFTAALAPADEPKKP